MLGLQHLMCENLFVDNWHKKKSSLSLKGLKIMWLKSIIEILYKIYATLTKPQLDDVKLTLITFFV